MALQMARTFDKYGVTATAAYHRIGNASIQDSGTGWGIRFQVKVYYSASARTSGKGPIHTESHWTNLDTSSTSEDQYNMIKFLYEYLKSLDSYENATDV